MNDGVFEMNQMRFMIANLTPPKASNFPCRGSQSLVYYNTNIPEPGDLLEGGLVGGPQLKTKKQNILLHKTGRLSKKWAPLSDTCSRN